MIQRNEPISMAARTAAAEAAYAYTDAAGTFPAPGAGWLSEIFERWSSEGKLNIFNQKIHAATVASDDAAGAATHGILRGGDYGTVFTSPEGLVNMVSSISRIEAERLPAVWHVPAGDDGEPLCTRREWACAGLAMQAFPVVLSSAEAQSAYDISLLAHLTAMEENIPVLHLFANTPERPVALYSREAYRQLADWNAIRAFRQRALLPEHPDSSMQFAGREQPVESKARLYALNRISVRLTPESKLPMYVYEGTPHAKRVLAVPAHLAPALERWLMEDPDVGVLKMRLLWPLDPAAIRQVLPDTAEQLEVLEVGAPGDRPFLYPALASALADSGLRAVPRYLARAEARSDQRGPLSRREGTETDRCDACAAGAYLRLLTDTLSERLVMTVTPGCAASQLELPSIFHAGTAQSVAALSTVTGSAAFALGVHVSLRHSRAGIMEQIAKMRAELSAADEAVCDRWLETRMDSRREISDPNGEALKRMVEKHLTEEGLVGDTCRFIRKNLWDLVFLKSEWVIGGDGWAGDSGVGSLLHILSMDENINILVLNNRCFAQTGGQLSKASPKGMQGGFYARGKRFPAMDLQAIARVFPQVYTASVNILTDPAGTQRTIREAAAYNGPALIVAEVPCANAGEITAL